MSLVMIKLPCKTLASQQVFYTIAKQIRTNDINFRF